ncbi:MAG: IS1380 family transposase [Thermodesulfobacteriota bacterium]|nr:IS1380 family transposase [Thermodesulfobacteriota bacterium]
MKKYSSSERINDVEVTCDTITGRGGLALFSRYLETISIFGILDNSFGDIRKSTKGLVVWVLFKQVFCWLFDGTSRHISYFDHIKRDKGYAGAIETKTSQMASSHAMKRFFKAFPVFCGGPFRWILHRLFIWRLRIEKPDEIKLYLDSMVMDNDDAEKRHGVQPTYKKKKGFQPLHIIWNNKIVDAIFRGGSKNGNHGDTVVNMVTHLVELIRTEYRQDITIILRCDSGFFDEKNFAAFDALNIIFISSGKMYEGIKDQVNAATEDMWNTYDNGAQKWGFLEFGFRCASWKRFFRTIYTHLMNDGSQMLFDFARPDNVIITNIGINEKALEYCTPERREYWLKATSIISSYHQCGADELAHRGLKDFAFEQFPFKRFGPNMALYYCMVIAFFLFETFKEDVLEEVIPIRSYASTVRRNIIDIACKIVKTGRGVILKTSQAVMDAFKIDLLWAKCQDPRPILS